MVFLLRFLTPDSTSPPEMARAGRPAITPKMSTRSKRREGEKKASKNKKGVILDVR